MSACDIPEASRSSSTAEIHFIVSVFTFIQYFDFRPSWSRRFHSILLMCRSACILLRLCVLDLIIFINSVFFIWISPMPFFLFDVKVSVKKALVFVRVVIFTVDLFFWEGWMSCANLITFCGVFGVRLKQQYPNIIVVIFFYFSYFYLNLKQLSIPRVAK